MDSSKVFEMGVVVPKQSPLLKSSNTTFVSSSLRVETNEWDKSPTSNPNINSDSSKPHETFLLKKSNFEAPPNLDSLQYAFTPTMKRAFSRPSSSSPQKYSGYPYPNALLARKGSTPIPLEMPSFLSLHPLIFTFLYIFGFLCLLISAISLMSAIPVFLDTVYYCLHEEKNTLLLSIGLIFLNAAYLYILSLDLFIISFSDQDLIDYKQYLLFPWKKLSREISLRSSKPIAEQALIPELSLSPDDEYILTDNASELTVLHNLTISPS
ncbi:hypothetical protein WA158_004628 [Blastocystis sp. Blastoise]